MSLIEIGTDVKKKLIKKAKAAKLARGKRRRLFSFGPMRGLAVASKATAVKGTWAVGNEKEDLSHI